MTSPRTLDFPFPYAFQQTKYGNLPSATSAPWNSLPVDDLVHVARESTDIGFIHFNVRAFSANPASRLR